MTAVKPWKDVRGPSPEDVIMPARTRQGKNKTVAANHVHEDPIPCDMALPESFQIPFERMVIVCRREPALLRQDADGLVQTRHLEPAPPEEIVVPPVPLGRPDQECHGFISRRYSS